MRPPTGNDDTIASGDANTAVDLGSAQTVAPNVDLGSAQTIATDLDLASAQTVGYTSVGSASAALANAAKQTLPVVPVEHYVRIDEYARGGLGRIMRAKDERTGRFVAIKEMLIDNADAAARFVREAMVTANLQHPAIVPVYEVGQWPDGKPFYAMKLVRGRALNDVIAATKTLDDRLALVSHVAAVADALAYAHGERVIHRDLKPHNVLCGDFGETVVIDWGLARHIDDTTTGVSLDRVVPPAPDATHVGAVMGTPSYMPPEQAKGERVDQQSDVYAIGAILYHLLAGRPPHVGKDLETLLDLVKNATPAKLPDDVPRDLVAIVERAMARDRVTRYPSAAELASDLRRFMTGQLVLAHHYTRGQRIARFVSRHRGVVISTGAALVIVAIVATVAIRNIVVARRDATVSRDQATASRDEARARLFTSYIDRAGLELSNGQAARSLAYTIASAQLAGLVPQTRLMAEHALRHLPPVRRFPDPTITNAVFAPGTHDLLFGADQLVRWDPETNHVRWRAPGLDRNYFRLLGRDTVVFPRGTALELITVVDGAPIGEMKGSGAKYDGGLGTDGSERWLAASSARSIDLFDSTTRALVATVPVASSTTPMVSADGERLIISAGPPAMSIVNRAGAVVATIKASLGAIKYAGDELVYAPPAEGNGIAHLVVGDWMGRARLDLPIGIGAIQGFAVDAANGRLAVGTNDGQIQVRSLASGDVMWQAAIGEQAGDMLFEGDLLRVMSVSGGAFAFDVASGIQVEHVSMPSFQAFGSEDRTRVALVTRGAGIVVWARQIHDVTPIAPTASRVASIAFMPDGGVIAASSDGAIHELRDGRVVRRLATGPAINSFARLDDGTLITSGPDGNVIVRDHDGTELRHFAGGVSAILSPDRRLLATSSADGTVAVWDWSTGTKVRELGKLGIATAAPRWSPDGRRIAVQTVRGWVTVWNVADASVVRKIAQPTFGAGNVAFSNDGKWLARPGEPSDTLYALDGGKDRRLADVRPSPAIHVGFTADDKLLVAAGTGFLSTWDVATGAARLRIATNTWLTSAAFFEHGSYIVAAGTDRWVRVWDTASGAELLRIPLPAQPSGGIYVDPNGKRIAVLTSRGAVLWTVPSFTGTLEDLQARARCFLDVEVIDGQLTSHPIDLAECNHVPL